MILAKLIAKVLSLTEALLDQFVTVQTAMVGSGINACTAAGTQEIMVYNVTPTACGVTLASNLAGLITMGIGLFQGILPGLMAVEN